MTTNVRPMNYDTCGSSVARAAHPPVRVGSLWAAVSWVIETLFDWQERARQRHELRTLGDFMLKDIGLSRADVEREASKPFWKV